MGEERQKLILAVICIKQRLLSATQRFLRLTTLDEIARLALVQVEASELPVGRSTHRAEMRRRHAEPCTVRPDQRGRHHCAVPSRARDRSELLIIRVELDVLDDGTFAWT